MNRKRPSGTGSNSTRVATAAHPETGQEVTIPSARAVAVAFYVANADLGWPRRPVVMIDHEIAGLVEGAVLSIEEMRQGRGMGDQAAYRIQEVRMTVRRFDGKFGQMLRKVLLVPVASPDDLGEHGPDDLDGAE